MTTTYQPIERISEGTVVEVPRFGAAEALSITFEGDSYVIEYARSSAGWDDTDTFTFKPGTVVECHDYQTFLRAESSVTEEELEAKAEATAFAIAEAA